jgi:hypothetical protein
MGKMFRSRNKAEEKEDDKLYKLLDGDISEIRRRLKIMYMADKERSEDYIHGMVVRLDRIRSSLFHYLLDGESAKLALENKYPGEKSSP